MEEVNVADQAEVGLGEAGSARLVRRLYTGNWLAASALALTVCAACRRHTPDVLILDTKLPCTDRVLPLRAVRCCCPETPTLAVVDEREQRCTISLTSPSGDGNDDRFPCCPHLDCIGLSIVAGALGGSGRS